MATIRAKYEGDLRTSAVHVKSGDKIITDAPVDNQGKGEAFSPTDLMAASLGSCMLTLMGIAARKHGFNIDGTEMSITKTMVENPRRVAEIKVEFSMPVENYTDKQKEIIERAAHTCPVALSIHPDIKQEVIFNFK